MNKLKDTKEYTKEINNRNHMLEIVELIFYFSQLNQGGQGINY